MISNQLRSTKPGLFSLRILIIASFIGTLLIAAGIGGYAMLCISSINSATSSIPEEMKGVILLGKMNEISQELRAVDVLAHHAKNDAERRSYLEANARAQEAFSAAWTDYAPTISDADEQALGHRLREVWQHFLAVEGEAMAFDRAGESVLASQVFGTAFRADSDAFLKAVNAVLDYRHHRAEFRVQIATEQGYAAIEKMIIALAVALLATLAIAGLIVRRVASPITAMTKSMLRLADQDLNVEIMGATRTDEIGAMASAMQIFKDNAIRIRRAEENKRREQELRAAEDDRLRREAEARAADEAATLVVNSIGRSLEHLAQGDLTQPVTKPLPKAYERLRLNLNTATDTLGTLLRDVLSNADNVSISTQEIARASKDLSRRTEQQAASIEETAAALEEITTTLRTTSSGAVHAQGVVAMTKTEAERSGSIVGKAVLAMAAIEQSSSKVSQIIGVIDEIAFQTNLLALNAGVEAARAGDAGRGFAVVASEVRGLAQRSAEAAKEIKTLILDSNQQVVTGVQLVRDTGEVLHSIIGHVADINTVVTEIATSAQEQAAALEQVNIAIGQMDQMTQQNAAMVEQSTAATQSLAADAAALAGVTAKFKTGSFDARDATHQGRGSTFARHAA